MIKPILGALFLISLIGCATYNSATGRNEMIFISTASEVKMGAQIAHEISSKNKILKDTPEAKRLDNIGQRLIRVSDRQDFQYHFALIDSEELNAYTIPGGYIYFYTGLFRKLSTDDQIASVLAHEIGHCTAKHTVKKFQGALGYDVVRNLILRIVELKISGAQGITNVAAMGADRLANLAMTAYGRKDEYEADQLGIKYLYLAGFDLNGMIQAFDVLQAEDKGSKVPLFLRTHPYMKDRIEAIKKEMALAQEKY